MVAQFILSRGLRRLVMLAGVRVDGLPRLDVADAADLVRLLRLLDLLVCL